MNPTLKTVLVNMAKNAVNAVLTNTALAGAFHSTFNFHDRAHMLNLLEAAGIAILVREAMVYGPKILAWSQKTD